MEFIGKLRKNLKYLKPGDLTAPFIFAVAYPLALVFRAFWKTQKKQIWLICESPDTARDNGYHFFKYLRTNHKELSVYYAIDKRGADYKKIKNLGEAIHYGSFKHWLYYLAADENISTQKAGNPSPALFYLLHIYGIIRNNRTFLQHGIIYNKLTWLYYQETRFKLVVCSAKKEYDYVKENFGYPEGSVVYTGLARFDNLYNYKKNPKQILIMPTWRNWLGRETNALSGDKEDFLDTSYYKHWNSLINNNKLLDFLHKNDVTLFFYPHFNMQRYAQSFKSSSKNVKIVRKEDVDIQDLLKESSLLITDYSSIFFDFAYMKKPLIYYQFDEEEFRKRQYKEGYFSHRDNGFGPVVVDEQTAVHEAIKYIQNNFAVESKYQARSDTFFSLRDQNNSRRIYQAIIESSKG